MYITFTQRIAATKYEKELIDAFAHAEEFTTSDLQGFISGIVYRISQDENLLDFETRLNRSKSFDLR